MKNLYYDVLVVGSGTAGLTLALHIDRSKRVALVSKSTLKAGASWLAQGGIAAVFDENDSTALHMTDTQVAGAGLCHKGAVEFVIKNGPDAIHWLINQGVNFTLQDDQKQFHLTQEGGHSHRRILHSADATGRSVTDALVHRVISASNIDVFQNHHAIDLITSANKLGEDVTCIGAHLLDIEENTIVTFLAHDVVLAAGGASKCYFHTSNPDGASGDGIAMAWRSGCRVGNLEFNQFHPTCLYHPKANSFLITEALRGEGGKLLLPDGSRFMHLYHEKAELAPRDVVARAIDQEMKRLKCACLYLDISQQSSKFIIESFPTVYEHCLALGIDITKTPIPIVPAAHYTCGGIVVNMNAQTDIRNLFAIGENAFTGLHGANRMASNSLLECVVYARAAASFINQKITSPCHPNEIPRTKLEKTKVINQTAFVDENMRFLRMLMWKRVGIVRTNGELKKAKLKIQKLKRKIDVRFKKSHINSQFLELRNIAVTCELIVKSALKRRESRGLHYNLDYPEREETAVDTILTPGKEPQ